MILLEPKAAPVVAHRGASGEYPENTLLAFDRALAQQADALELDVRLTADGVPVVIHDSTVDRTTDGSGPVGSFAASALEALDAGRGERIPTLATVLDRYPDTPIILELKEPRAARPVADLLLSHGAAERVLVGAFEHAALGPFSEPPFRRAASRRETLWGWLASRIGWAIPCGTFRAFTVPERHGAFRVVDPAFVRAAARRGLPVHVWTVNQVADARRLRALGVAGIITNFPARMRGL